MARPLSRSAIRRIEVAAGYDLDRLLGVAPRRSYIPVLLPLLEDRPLSSPAVAPQRLGEVEDRRLWSPLGRSAPPAILPGASRLARRLVPSRRPGHVSGLSFFIPGEVAVCVRRKVRREVLFAKGGAHPSRHRRRNAFSDIGC